MSVRAFAWIAAVTLFVLTLAPSAALSQAATATLRGTVLDETKAVVPGTELTVHNLATGLQRSAVTDDDGTFVFSLVPPGSYRLTARRSGLATSEIPNLVLNVGDALEIRVVLRVAGLDTSVTVTAEATRVSTSPAVATVVDRQFVENLPLNGRSFQSLITMTPGVVLTPAASTTPGQFSVNGQRSDANYFMVDGVSANVAVQSTAGLGPSGAGAAPGLSVQGGTNSLVSVDALQEFKIETSTYAPEFGRTPGAQISIVTRSGTNQYRGTLFEYFRDDALDARDYFVKRQGLAKPKERQHDFGGVFGGPITRDRMFLFTSYERLRLEQPRSAVTEVPSLESRAAAADAVRPILTAFSLPNGPNTANGLARFSASYADPFRLRAASVRVDRTLGKAVTIFGRYNHAPSDGSSRLGSFAAASVSTTGWVRQHLQTLTVGATWVANPTWSNELRTNWSRHAGKNFQTLDAFGGAVVPPAAMLHPAFTQPDSVYRVNLSAPNVFFDEGLNSSNLQRQVNIVNVTSMTRARHQMKVGIDYRHLFPIYGPVDYVQSYTFSGVQGVLAGTAASMLTAAPSRENRSSHADQFSAFAQDTWSSASALTLTYGIRWDVNPAPRLSHSDQALALASAEPATLALAPPGTAMYRTTYGNVAPRVGATYKLRDAAGGTTLVRGGWGIFFDLGSTATMENLANSYPFTARRDFFNVSFPANPALLTPPTIVPGSPVDFLSAADPNLELPYTHQWNVTLEQELMAPNTVTVSYVGAVGRRLLRQERFLNPTPQFQFLTLGTNHGHSRYDALQVKYSRRLSRGLQALASYTFGRSRDNASVDTVPLLPSSFVDPEQDWGPSDFDVRHAFNGGATYVLPGGWSVAAVFAARSALPVNVVTGLTAFGVSSGLRPDYVAGAPFYVRDSTVPGGRRFDRAAFATPPLDPNGNQLRQGTLPRNALRGFAMSQVDLAVHRRLRLAALNVELRVEAFNLFNQASFGPPANALTSGFFGQPTRTFASSLGAGGVVGGGLSPLYQVGGPRSIQLGFRLQF